MAKAAPTTPSAFPSAIKYKTLKVRNDEYKADFWARCRALYSGGPTLLEDPEVLKHVMPMHGSEEQSVYKERCARAFYIPYPGSIVDKIVSELMGKPITFDLENTTDDPGDGGSGERSQLDTEQEKHLPPYYSDLVKNCSKAGGAKLSLAQFARNQMFTALQCRYAWALVDMPKAPERGYANLKSQVDAGGLDAYICPIDPECVVDWEMGEDGELEWALIQDKIAKRDSIAGDRSIVTLRWRYYTKDAWAIYEYKYDITKKATGPTDNDEAALVDQGKHTFQKVPVRRLVLPEGLWAMGKLEAMARAHMNQRNALSWGQLKALYPVPVLYVQKPEIGNDVSEDMGRASQTHGQGYMRVLAENDRLEYFSPDTAPYKIAMDDLAGIRDEMHRVLHHMAMSVDNSGAALQRSADSKAIDQAAASVILRALGMLLREHLEELLGLISTGRKDNLAFCAHGMDNFDDVTLSQLVVDAVGISAVDIPSATFQKKFKLKIAKLALGSDVSEEDLVTIAEELEQTTTQDSFQAEQDTAMAQHGAKQATANATAEDPTGAFKSTGPLETKSQKKELADMKKMKKSKAGKPGAK
jgi:hypothetical protein